MACLINGGATGNQLSGNFIGTTAGGSAALGNRGNGVEIVGANNNALFGCLFTTSPFVFYNVISGNGENGLVVNNSNNTTIQANFFGVGADNHTGIGNALNGVLVEGTSTNTVMGGPIPLGNVDAANGQNGIVVEGTASGFTSYNTFDGLAAFSYQPNLGNGHDGDADHHDRQQYPDSHQRGHRKRQRRHRDRRQRHRRPRGRQHHRPEHRRHRGHGQQEQRRRSRRQRQRRSDRRPATDVQRHSAEHHLAATATTAWRSTARRTISRSANGYIGTDITGNSARPNGGAGVSIGPGSYGNTIGSPDSTLPTRIAGNTGNGITMNGTTGNTILGTTIGIAANGSALGNHGSGIALTGSSNNTIGSTSSAVPQNKIANNTASGVIVNSGTQDAIHQNSIYSNGSLGITLTAGANNNQAAPVLTAVNATSTATQVTGTLP